MNWKRLFPAYAGVIRDDADVTYNFTAFPRIRGGDPYLRAVAACKFFFSPHTRG